MKKLFYALFLSTLISAKLFPQSAIVDTSFGKEGIAFLPGCELEFVFTDLLVQPDNKIVSSGYSFDLLIGEPFTTIARFYDNGSLDTTLNYTGYCQYEGAFSDDNFSGEYGAILDMQSDNKIIAALPLYDLKLVRWNMDGSIDNTFGTDGVFSYDFTTSEFDMRRIKILSDDKILFTGVYSNGADHKILLGKLNADGGFDTSFGGGSGYTILSLDGVQYASSVEVLPGGKIIVGGYGNTDGSSYNNFMVVKFNANGTLNTAFGTGGITYTDLDAAALSNDVCDNLEITPEGKIILIGLAANDIGIVQYTLTGALDSSFNEDGKSIIPTAYGATINDFKILDDGSIIACGAMEINATGNSDNAIFKFDNNGDPYLSFADSGVFKVPNDYIASDSVTFIDLHAYDKISITNESEIIVGYAVDIYGEYWAGHGVSKILLINACEIAPSGLFADNIMSNKAKLHWNADAGALKYKVQYRPTTSAAWTTVNGTTNIKAITGLAANTTYKYRVRSQCSPTLVSPWSAVSTFTTLPLKEGKIISEDELEIHIYPNPASDKINIELNETPHNMGSIHIYDIAGKLIEIKPLINQSTQLTLSLDPGIYFFELISYDGTTQTEKVIIE